MDVTSSRAGDQLQPLPCGLQSAFERAQPSTLVNVGISQQNRLPEGSEAWNPNGDSVREKQGSKLLCEVYRNDVLVKFDRTSVQPPEGCKRGEIKEASRESLNRLFLLANNADVTVFKRALNHYLIRAKRAGFGNEYIWVREHQENGAPHFHVLHTAKVESSFSYQDAFGSLREIDRERSRDLSVWWTEQLAKGAKFDCSLCRTGAFVECEQRGGWCGESFRKMALAPIAEASWVAAVWNQSAAVRTQVVISRRNALSGCRSCLRRFGIVLADGGALRVDCALRQLRVCTLIVTSFSAKKFKRIMVFSRW
jgi:hypothetical protein